MNLPQSRKASEVLVDLAVRDSDPNVRSRAAWSLISHSQLISAETPRLIYLDQHLLVRRAALELAYAMRDSAVLLQATNDSDRRIADLAKYLHSRLASASTAPE